jgi:hypothetical protein
MEVARNQYHKESHYLKKENGLLIDKLENLEIKNHLATIDYKDNDKEHRSKRMSRYRKARGPLPTSRRGFPRLLERGESSDRSSDTLLTSPQQYSIRLPCIFQASFRHYSNYGITLLQN